MKDHYSALGFQTATFNPLDILDRNDPNAVSLAHTLASTICPITDPKQSFWQGSAANILAGVLLWLTDNPLEQKTLARAREIVTLPKKDFLKIIAQMMACDAFQGAIREAIGQASDTSAADTYGGIMYNLQQTTAFISDSQIKTSTSTSSIPMEKLSAGALTVYLVIPFKLIKTHSTWLRLVIASAMHAMIASRENPSGKTLRRCMFMIDEFGSIGHIPDVASQLAQMRGYGMDFTLVLQGLNQLKEHYGDAKDSILGNCRYKYFCDVNDLESAKWLSETLGKKTVETLTKSESQGSSKGGQTEGTSTTLGETGRALLTPDEIMLLGRDTAILLNPDTRPHYLHPVDYWKLTQAYQHLSNSYPNLYWQPALTYDQNPAINNSAKSQNVSSSTSYTLAEALKKFGGKNPGK
jgi:type IV secretion system protein VirD4